MKNIFKPILFSTPMIRAILEGRKTQTRRTKGLDINDEPDNWFFDAHGAKNGYYVFSNKQMTQGFFPTAPCEVGNILWVRENLYQNGELGLEYFASKESINEGIIPFDYGPYGGTYSFRAIPNIHMPKWACRIFLKVVSVKVERVQDITEEDSIAEGAIQYESDTDWLAAKYGFQIIWETINGKESWKENPFVWVIEFERIEKPLDFIV